MGDPWGTESLSNTEYSLKGFEDNFVTENRLPDSVQYLENLEKKLSKLKARNSKDKELLKGLSQTKQSHLERFIESDSGDTVNDLDLDQPIPVSNLHRFIAPEKQAKTISELYELIKYDQLGQLFEELENKT